jgi:hypothetical protein
MRSFLLLLVIVAAVVACGGSDAPPEVRDLRRDDSRHVHGLGLNRGDGALFIATHSGLWRSEPGGGRVTPVGRARRDIKGFSVVGPDRFLASGHPARGEEAPPVLGLLESRNAGETWRPKSLYARADFHIIRPAGERLYAVDARTGELLSTADDGWSWRRRLPPAAFIDLAVHPRDPSHLVAATDAGLQRSTDGGRNWRSLGKGVGALAWAAGDELYLVDRAGTVSISDDGGRSFKSVGVLDGVPAAIAHGGGRLFAALEDATVWESRDGGRSWRRRAQPR